ncbi:unnamed protein product [Mytilus edulis]|uniref:Uncharacterized protein n=1 Tax=Mytilus edulis TaxID=6550 RepID=A0A8S3VL87_MYTED|nr:unnamed protein product [Mytilus edulis]
MQSDFKKMTIYATDLQMYVGLIQIEKSTVQASKYLTDLESGNYFKEKNLEVNISSAKKLVLQNFKSFGDIRIHTSPSTLPVNSGRKNKAQHLVPIPPMFEQMKPVLLRRLSKPDNIDSLDIRACIVLPDGKFIILDRNKKQLLLYGNDGIFAKQVLTMTLIPFDACLVKKNIVAVTFGRTKQTSLIDIEQSTIIQIIKIAHHCNAVASDGQILVISGSEKTTKVNLNDVSYTIVERVRASRIALFQGNIYSTINYCNANEVCCYKSTGELIWRFQHDGIYSNAGLALDKKGFVYIVSQENNDIMVVSPDGKTSKTILSEKDGIKYPWAIDINREEGLMIVSSGISDNELDQTAFVYKI